jgi:hypothetical protein
MGRVCCNSAQGVRVCAPENAAMSVDCDTLACLEAHRRSEPEPQTRRFKRALTSTFGAISFLLAGTSYAQGQIEKLTGDVLKRLGDLPTRMR